MNATYCVYSWDHEIDDWHPEAEVSSAMRMRAPIRELLGRGYDWDLSILVERSDGISRNSRVGDRKREAESSRFILAFCSYMESRTR